MLRYRATNSIFNFSKQKYFGEDNIRKHYLALFAKILFLPILDELIYSSVKPISTQILSGIFFFHIHFEYSSLLISIRHLSHLFIGRC